MGTGNMLESLVETGGS